MYEISKEYTVIVDPAVNDRMYDHFEFLARVNETAAERLLVQLADDMQSLERLPYRNPVFNRPYLKIGKYRYMVSCEKYLIVYQIVDNTVFIDDIQDSRQSDDKSLLYLLT
ncbi:MAG: type II toxin-antitoxin system RelE/ParE family toxin [Defluviitaleaceae bacterium]|nr:type II toxin-antitoxin system RelE/ParE family toxin [Defluviitaleaceae bacterium]